jgi:serine phosphatase RsbU (regulator of sigma subunit)
VDQLGFSLAFDTRLPSGDRWLSVAPPDGTAMLGLVAPKPGSEEYRLIGQPTEIVFLTEDVFAKVEEWRSRGVRFRSIPHAQSWGGMSASFEDRDGNSFTLLEFDELTREIEEQRRAHLERSQSARLTAQELENARLAQARLFPQTLPNLTTLECAGACSQARHVGGDYYDFLDLGNERLGLVIGDISGKGMAAALLMANLQAHLRNQCAIYWSRPFTPFVLDQPQRSLVSVNRCFRENTTDSIYTTLFFAEYDDRTQRLRYANCGHPPAVLLRRDNKLERLDSTCTVLGLFKEWDCAVGERHMSPGDILVLYTDGVTESFSAEGEEFGEERLIEALYRHRELPLRDLVASVIDDVRSFSPQDQHDDITVVVAQCRGD